MKTFYNDLAEKVTQPNYYLDREDFDDDYETEPSLEQHFEEQRMEYSYRDAR